MLSPEDSTARRSHLREEILNLKQKILTLETSKDLLSSQRHALLDEQLNQATPGPELDRLTLETEEKLREVQRESQELIKSRLTLISRLRASYVATTEPLPTLDCQLFREQAKIIEEIEEEWPLSPLPQNDSGLVGSQQHVYAMEAYNYVLSSARADTNISTPKSPPRIFESPRDAPTAPTLRAVTSNQHTREIATVGISPGAVSPTDFRETFMKSFSMPTAQDQAQAQDECLKGENRKSLGLTNRRSRQLSLNKALPRPNLCDQNNPVREEVSQTRTNLASEQLCHSNSSTIVWPSTYSDVYGLSAGSRLLHTTDPPLWADSVAVSMSSPEIENAPKDRRMDYEVPVIGPALTSIDMGLKRLSWKPWIHPASIQTVEVARRTPL